MYIIAHFTVSLHGIARWFLFILTCAGLRVPAIAERSSPRPNGVVRCDESRSKLFLR